MAEELSLCECGCGERVNKLGNKFINGHQNRKRKHSLTSRLSMLEGRKNPISKQEPKLCACGCGEYALPGNDYINSHQNRGRKPHNAGEFKPKPEPKLCECGCREYALPGNDYINGHQSRGRERSLETIAKQSKAMKGKHCGKDGSFYGKIHSPKSLAEMSVANSGENNGMYGRRGGEDIVNHHYIYDHANPELYTMKITRAKHTQIHNWMKKAGIVVPHINEDVGPWKYATT